VNAAEVLDGIAALSGARDAGIDGSRLLAGQVLQGTEFARADSVQERTLRRIWKERRGGGATPLVLFADDPSTEEALVVLGPQPDGPLRRIRADALLGLATRTAELSGLAARRLVAEEVERLDAERIAGLRVHGLGTEHLYGSRLPASPRWEELRAAVEHASRTGWRELLTDLGYAIESLPKEGYLARDSGGGPVAVVFPRAEAAQFARLDADGKLPEGALIRACRDHGAAWGILAAGTRLRLLAADAEATGSATRYLELDATALDERHRPLLGLLAPASLADGGLRELLVEARDYGQELRTRLDRTLRQDVLPALARELGRWARAQGRDLTNDDVRREVESAALLWVFRALFLLYAEGAGYLPMTNRTYAEKSLTRIAERAWEERERRDPAAAALWDDVAALVRRMRDGQRAWDLPAYNGDLFAPGDVDGAALLEGASVADAALAPALVALARDPDEPEVGVDFSGLEIGHLGYVYEGLLSLRLSVADRDYVYDERRDRYRPPQDDEQPDVAAGDLVWMTDEGGRKGGGVYYTRTDLVRHLVRGAVGPAFDRHLADVAELAARDPAAAASRLFEFYVLDPACGSAHFLVEVVDELADKIATLLGERALPDVAHEVERLRAGAGATFGAGIEDTALLKRLVLKRCVFGVDLSPLGTEIAKLSLWLATFVPGLSLAYLDHNVKRGNALIGVARPEDVAPPQSGDQISMFGEDVVEAIGRAAQAAMRVRAMQDRTPEEFAESREADREAEAEAEGAARVFDLWTAEALDPDLVGARDEVLREGRGLLGGQDSLLAERAAARCAEEHVLHWPLAFAEVFARERPGFDAVVGNPPWDEVTVEELAFYARYRPGLRGLPQRARERELVALLRERPELPERLAAEQERLAAQRAFFAREYETRGSDPDTYRFFSQRYRDLLRERGALGVVLPRTAFSAKGSLGFREWLLEAAQPRRIDFLKNRRQWAFDITPQYSVALLTAERVALEVDASFTVAGVADSVEAFARQVRSPGIELRRSALGRLLEVPLLPSQAVADLLARMRRTDPFPWGGGRWRCFPVAELHESQDKRLWERARGGLPLWKGESFDQFDPHGAAARLCPDNEEVMRKVRKPRPGSDSLLAQEAPLSQRRDAVLRELDRARVAFRDVARATDSRTVRATLVPPHIFLTNTAPYLAFLDEDPRRQAAALGVLNSLPFDWQARRFVELHVNFFILEGLTVPELSDAHYDAIVSAAARLSVPDERFADFAAATGVEVGRLDPEERDSLRAEIDARVARAWGLDADDLEVIFSGFKVAGVPEDYRALVRGRFAELA